jgi:membrane-bound inhibitor of C-type lysozyme
LPTSMAAAVADISAPWRRDGFAVPGLLDEAFQSGRNNMTKAFSLITGLLLLATWVGAAQATTASYQCSGGTRPTAEFSSPSSKSGRVVLDIEGSGKVTLPQEMSADGGRYAGKGIEFWIKGNGATLRPAA